MPDDIEFKKVRKRQVITDDELRATSGNIANFAMDHRFRAGHDLGRLLSTAAPAPSQVQILGV
nr:hypothetical protein [Microvirga rosea]